MSQNKYAGTQTEKNLLEAFAGESQARNKYTYFASKAKKEGYEQIAALFLKTAENEKEHAKLWFKLFQGIGDTYENLLDAAAGENEEWTVMYKEMAATAREEGFDEIAEIMEGVAEIEREHEKRYLKLAQCQNCGHIYVGKEAPEVCPVCNHPQAHFQVKPENY